MLKGKQKNLLIENKWNIYNFKAYNLNSCIIPKKEIGGKK